ncbi:sentrin-specific protease 1-like [Olea europaea subsp. europaea]|uniref:Sentrin-specific protease 1-like n=1 Tax=Olea europaea subsp. europaea TaxID=158383 RepID=A0A8S0V9X4_OLEEU|nr:sentrin-specific protease 1-like [Olea europaea subsp. europaea]
MEMDGIKKGCLVNEYEDTEAVEGFEKIDKKGKGKVDPTEDVAFPSSFEPPSFDLGIGYTQPDDLQSAKIQKQGSPSTEPASELPVKRASRLARIPRSPFVAGEGKVPRHDGNVIIFGNYKDHVEEADKSAFLGWFQKGYKPKNRHIYNDGLLVPKQDKRYILAFQKDPQVLFSESSLIRAVTGHLISLSTSSADVDYVFMPLLPTNKAHWMLGLVEFRSHTLMLFNSAGKTYRDWKVLEGIEPYVKVLSALMKALGISKKDPDYNESECKQMKVTIDSTLPQ